MRTPKLPCLLALALFITPAVVRAQNELGRSLKDIEVADHWIYDDLPKAFAKAKATGKPILVVLRCVPCPPGRTLDKQVMQPGEELEELQKQFVCVRIIKTNGLDLNLFQYDYDQSWTAMFLNADKVIYGRYGTRVTNGPRSDSHISLPGFRKALQRALALHKNYPGNKKELAGNTGPAPKWRRPELIPGLKARHKTPVTRKSCIHCHMVREYQLRAKWEQGDLARTDLFVFPMPDNIGITMDVDDGLRVKSVKPSSFAAKAGLAAGDGIVSLNGRPLTSLADIQWALHHMPEKADLALTIRRAGKTLERTIALSGNWKESDIAWRASSWYGLRQGLKTQPLSVAQKKKRGIAADGMALVVKGLFGKGRPILQKYGLRVGDIIVAVDGKNAAMNESQFLVFLRLTHGPRDTVTLTTLREDKRRELKMPMW